MSEHNIHWAYDIYVEEAPKREALKRLHERMAADESPYIILGIAEQNKYYVDKIVAGHGPMSYGLYRRIMNADEEDAFDL